MPYNGLITEAYTVEWFPTPKLASPPYTVKSVFNPTQPKIMVQQQPAVTIYHNPRCSKSRKALELIEKKGMKSNIVLYLKAPPDKDELERILRTLGMEPRDLMRKKERIYRENHLDNPALSRSELIDAMIKHPILIERPIVLANDQAVLGRPPENVLKIL